MSPSISDPWPIRRRPRNPRLLSAAERGREDPEGPHGHHHEHAHDEAEPHTQPADPRRRRRSGRRRPGRRGAYWWQDRQELSQASAEDCRLAQRIVTEGARIAAGPAPEAEQWWQETGDERRATMEDGYLGAKISRYEGWALQTAKNPGGAPSAKDVKNLQEDAQGHCVDSGVTLALPPLGS
ncbi:hypothetical protein ACFQV4_06015 [Streptomyces thermocarboxydus]